MKKIILGGLIGGIIIFIWQFLSFALLDLHRPATQYTPKQNEILSYLSTQFDQDGSYFMPNSPPDASSDEMERLMTESQGKPWAIVSYRKSLNTDMSMNMIRGLLVNIVMVGLFCWIISRMAAPRFGTIVVASLLVGLIIFINVPYTNHIWYESFDLMAYFLDSIIAWGVTGIWLGYLYSGKTRTAKTVPATT